MGIAPEQLRVLKGIARNALPNAIVLVQQLERLGVPRQHSAHRFGVAMTPPEVVCGREGSRIGSPNFWEHVDGEQLLDCRSHAAQPAGMSDVGRSDYEADKLLAIERLLVIVGVDGDGG